jgi:hypothetical protein
MAQGFAFGTGSAVARNVVNSVMGGSSAPAPVAPAAPVTPQSSYNGACATDHQAFMACLQQNPGNTSTCDFYFTALQACEGRQ